MQEPLLLVATPKILQSGKIIIWNNTLYFGNSSNTPTKVSSDTVPTHYHSASDINSGTLSISRGGTGNTSGLAASATKLETARTIRVNLESTNSVSFDGSANITPGITGTLSASHGGTGYTSLSSLKSALNIPTTSFVYGTFIMPKESSVDKDIYLGFQPRMVIMIGVRANCGLVLGGNYSSSGHFVDLDGKGSGSSSFITNTGFTFPSFQTRGTGWYIDYKFDYIAIKN